MAQVTIRTPDAPPVADVVSSSAPLGPDAFRDSRGRVITLRTLSILEQMRLLRALGGENAPYYSFCLRLARVSSIDGDPVNIPQKELQWDALAQRLGDSGVIALTTHLIGGDDDEEGGDSTDAAAAAEAARARDASERDTVKN